MIALEERVFGAWINFARNGNPNHPGIPYWPACKPGDEATMIFDMKRYAYMGVYASVW